MKKKKWNRLFSVLFVMVESSFTEVEEGELL